MSGMLDQVNARLDRYQQKLQTGEVKPGATVRDTTVEKESVTTATTLAADIKTKMLATPATQSLHVRLEAFAKMHNMSKRQATIFLIERGFDAMGLESEMPVSEKDLSAYKLKKEVSKIAKANVYVGHGGKDELIVYAPTDALVASDALPQRCDGYYVRLERMGSVPPAGTI